MGHLCNFSLYLDPLFWKYILENAFLLECILENAFSRMDFAENSAFGKILKLFINNRAYGSNLKKLILT